MNQQLIELGQREQDINKLSQGVQEVSDLFMDISLLVSYQGNKLDNIENNISQTFENTQKANNQLHQAQKYQQKRRLCYVKIIGCFCLSSITMFLIVSLIDHIYD